MRAKDVSNRSSEIDDDKTVFSMFLEKVVVPNEETISYASVRYSYDHRGAVKCSHVDSDMVETNIVALVGIRGRDWIIIGINNLFVVTITMFMITNGVVGEV